MRLSKIAIKNYRLLVDAELEVDENTTLIVGRNNTAKTSCIDCIDSILKGTPFSYDDYPIGKRSALISSIEKYMSKEISFVNLLETLDYISIDFLVDYLLDDQNDNLGALSPFIIDVDESVSTALIRAEYRLKIDEKVLWNLFEPCFYKNGKYNPDIDEVRSVFISHFNRIFGIVIYAVNPTNQNDKQVKSQKELTDLFPLYTIPAERVLGEDGAQNDSSLGKLITNFFNVNADDLDPSVSKEISELRKIVEEANKIVQKQSDTLLSSVVQKAIGFGYPNREELQLAVATQLSIDEQIKNQTKLTYISGSANEALPGSHNGLGYKNLIKIEFLLAGFAKEVEDNGTSCIPLLFIEEPESHMHPQMQNAFAEYLEKYLEKISSVHIQTFLTSHSAHIANTVDFSKVRYAQKTSNGVIYRNLKAFTDSNPENIDFIKKYLTLSKCDLFFADKVILVEGASERLLIPDMIAKCDASKLFESRKYKLSAQYYSLIEVGGAYAHIFIPFINFLDIPCLIITDIDSTDDSRKKVIVSKGTKTSNATLKWWVKEAKGLREKDLSTIALADVVSLTEEQKTIGKCHIEFQIEEKGLCGRSLEEAMKNVNRNYFGLSDSITEDDLVFTDSSKTDFALDFIYKKPDYAVPRYIETGLVWLNDQNVLS